MDTSHLSPVSVYVVWHPQFKRGQEVADFIYANFARDAESPLSRGIGLPVYYRSTTFKNQTTPIDIPLEKSEYNAIVVLVEDYMFNDDGWNKFVKGLIKKTNTKNRLFPVAFSKNSFSFEETSLGKEQYIDVRPLRNDYADGEFEKNLKVIRSRLLHGLCRLLLNKAPENEKYPLNVPPPVSLFISHAKHDGEKEAHEFRDYIRANTKLSSFFDTNDIADGYQFDSQIKKALAQLDVALIVFLSDAYATREWCQIEILTAKRYKAPVVVVYNIAKGEKRSFPYLGNVPTIKFSEKNFEEIIDLTLMQVLVNVFSRMNLLRVLKLYTNLDIEQFALLSSPPELFNFPDLMAVKSKNPTAKILNVLYPDPPLGNVELEVLNDMKSGMKFLTPVQLSTLI